MRPRGEVRLALRRAASALHEVQGHFSFQDLAPMVPGVSLSSPADLQMVQTTVSNMARAGELVCVGKHKPEGARTWLCLYEPAEPVVMNEAAPVAEQAYAPLAFVLGQWPRDTR